MLNLQSAAFALKTLYPKNKIQRLVYEDQPFLAMIPKDEEFFGDSKAIPLIYGNPQGRSAKFSTAQANKGSTKGIKFSLTRARDYSLVDIDNETMKAAGNSKGAVINALETETDGGFSVIKRSAGTAGFRDGSGAIGQIGTVGTGGNGYTTKQVLLASINDAVNFENGMVLQASGTKTGGAVRAGTLTIVAVDRDAGVLTFSADVTTGIAAAVANDYLYVQDDYDSKMKGLDAWLPATAPAGGDNFFGVDRSVDPVRLAGCRVDGTTMAIDEAFIKGAARADREGGKLSHYFTSHPQWLQLEYSQGSRVQYVDYESEVGIGFRGIRVNGPKGPISVFADVNCPNDVAYGLQMDTWELASLGPVPHFLDEDGNKMLRESNADAYEIRLGYYGNFACYAPGYNVRVKLPAANF
jgi:hypothetical protein